MKQFSFFKTNKGFASGLIRADQIAEYLGGRVNPTNNYENDICIYTKCLPPENFPECSYFDVNDYYPFAPWITAHPKIKIIAASRIAQDFIQQSVKRNDIVFIPQHHCNYLREKMESREIKTAGIIGGNRSYELNRDILKKMLGEIGVEYAECIHPKSRQDVVDFYKTIDIQIVFRPRRSRDRKAGRLSTSLKLANAGSFGISTVSFPEDAFTDEFFGCFLSAETPTEVVTSVDKLRKDKVLYEDLSAKSMGAAEKYHIENVAKLYKQL